MYNHSQYCKGYIMDGLPSLCEEYMTISDQLALIKNWKLKPDFIINLKVYFYICGLIVIKYYRVIICIQFNLVVL